MVSAAVHAWIHNSIPSQLFFYSSPAKFRHSNSLIGSPIVYSGIGTPKFAAIVAPSAANVSLSEIRPLSLNEGEYAIIGTFSLV